MARMEKTRILIHGDQPVSCYSKFGVLHEPVNHGVLPSQEADE